MMYYFVPKAADRAFEFGVVAAVPTALAGVTDWGDTEGRQRRTGLMHALLNTVALSGFIGSVVGAIIILLIYRMLVRPRPY